MRYITQRIFFVIVPMVILFAGCKGKEGDPGPAGTDGLTGVGLDDGAKYGGVKLFLNGTTWWGDAFKDTIDFKFASADLFYSRATEYEPNDIGFRLRRYSGFNHPDDDDYLSMSFEPIASGSDTTWYFDVGIQGNVYLETSHKSFRFDDSYYNDYESNISDESFDGYKYDSSTGHLYFRFSFVVGEDYNDTGHTLNVSGIVDATVYQEDED